MKTPADAQTNKNDLNQHEASIKNLTSSNTMTSNSAELAKKLIGKSNGSGIEITSKAEERSTSLNGKIQVINKLNGSIIFRNLQSAGVLRELFSFMDAKSKINTAAVSKMLHDESRILQKSLKFTQNVKSSDNLLQAITGGFSNSDITSISIDFIKPGFLPKISSDKFSKVEHLSLSNGVSGINDDQVLNEVGEKFPNLKHLNLRNNFMITDKGVSALAAQCPNLVSLDLGKCNKITDSSLKALAKYCPSLSSLNLDKCTDITDVSLERLAKDFPNLSKLSLKGCTQLVDTHIAPLADAGLKFTSLDLSGCYRLTAAAISRLVSKGTNLTTLHLEGRLSLTNGCINQIATSCPNLTSLNLNESMLSVSQEAIVGLVSACKELTDLGLKSAHWETESGPKELAENTPNLLSLDFSNSFTLKDSGIAAIADHCKSLKTLNLEKCSSITDKSLIALAKNATNLRQLNLTTCMTKISGQSIAQLEAKNCRVITSERSIFW